MFGGHPRRILATGENDYAENGRYTNISMEIIHGENVD